MGTPAVVIIASLYWASLAAGYSQDYKGFNTCGMQGWSCAFVSGGYETTYHCNVTTDKNARIWVWTARIPSHTTILTVRDCNHVEVHTDCTKGYRSYSLKEFRAINIGKLEILDPLRPGTYLHDNDQIMQAAPKIFVQNVKELIFPPEWLKKPEGSCKYKSVTLENLIFDNVGIRELPMHTLRNAQPMKTVDWSTVAIQKWNPEAISMRGDFILRESEVGEIFKDGLVVGGGDKVLIENNTINYLNSKAINSTNEDFQFTNNQIGTMWSGGISVLARNAQINHNRFQLAGSSANNTGSDTKPIGHFETIAPGYSPKQAQIASPYVYNFSNNLIEYTESKAGMHFGMNPVYFEVCSEVTVQGNLIDCACKSLLWLEDDPRFLKVLFNPQNRNKCIHNGTCPISSVVDLSSKTCKSEDTCLDYEELRSDPTESVIEATEQSNPIPEMDNKTDSGSELDIDEHWKLSLQEGDLESRSTSLPAWLIVVLTVLAILLIVGVFLTYKKVVRKKEQIVMKYNAGDLDSVMLVNDH